MTQLPSLGRSQSFILVSVFAGMLALLCSSAVRIDASSSATLVAERVFNNYGKLPLSFEPNRGQAPGETEFVARGSAYTILLLRSGEAMLGLRSKDHGVSSVLRVKLMGANARAGSGQEEQHGRSNYFIGSDPSGWRTNIPNYGRVEYREIYPGVDLVYYGNQRRLEFDFIVAPGTDPAAIRMNLDGAQRIGVDRNGNLVATLSKDGREVRFNRPLLYREVDGARRPVQGRYVVSGNRQVGFDVGRYDRNRPLVIDPVLAYSTYLGGSGGEAARGIAVDSAGRTHAAFTHQP